jgi:hypothetical protein
MNPRAKTENQYGQWKTKTRSPRKYQESRESRQAETNPQALAEENAHGSRQAGGQSQEIRKLVLPKLLSSQPPPAKRQPQTSDFTSRTFSKTLGLRGINSKNQT